MTTSLVLNVELESSDDQTPEELDDLTRSLLGEIEIGIKPDSADLVMEQAPPGTRAVGAVTIGAIALALAPVLAEKLVDLLIDWSKRNDSRKVSIVIPVGKSEVTVEYNPSRMKPDELRKMIANAVAAAQAGAEG